MNDNASRRFEPKAPATSDASTILDPRQLSLGLWFVDSNASDETRHLKIIAKLERDAESARFDWTEFRDHINAPTLWGVFAYKAKLLEQALAAMLPSGIAFAHDK